MDAKISILLLLLFKTCLSHNLDNFFQKINNETLKFNAIAAEIAWETSINPSNPELPRESAKYQKKRIAWQHQVCNELGTLYKRHLLNDTQRRQAYLLCRGPRFSFEEARLMRDLYEELQTIYSDAKVCIPIDNPTPVTNLSNIEDAILSYLSNVKQFLNFESDYVQFAAKIAVNSYPQQKEKLCLKGENDFEKMMAFSRKENVLKWLWLTWREKVGPPMKRPYRELAGIENHAARRNGYPNIGASWRDELEMPTLRSQCRRLYNDVMPLYKLLHGVLRFYLRRYYGDVVPRRGPIPAHLLGNLWSQNWEPLADLMLPNNVDLDRDIKQLNWTVVHMVKRAEDFYQSLGLPAMTDQFWRESVLARANNSDARCHGTAADMFQNGDFRLLYCSEITKEDFYVLHHELGHIQYYMAYENQPALFRQANAALHETIGDTIMYGVLTPQHLNRLGLINDSLLYTSNNNTDQDSTDDTSFNFEDNQTDSEEIVNSDIDIKDKSSKDSDISDSINVNEELNHGESKIHDFKGDVVNGEKIVKNIESGDVFENNVPNLFDSKEITIDMQLLFKQALNKLPQIPFALLLDEYRWKYFEGRLERDNKGFWDLVEELQGVAPPGKRGEEYFDAGAKFHVPDNTPYIRYFLSSFLQHQLFEKLCKAAVFGRRNVKDPLPVTISLSRCDIYGSKAAGKILRDLMSRGHSQHWSGILQETIEEEAISASALNLYYRPLYKVLKTFVRKHHIPIGW